MLQIRVAACLCIGVLLFPMLRNAGLVPTDDIVEFLTRLTSPERAYSLWQRFHNEDILMVKASERPMFGWGGWGRARIYNELGRDVSTTDGYWVILFGEGGWARYIGEFGLLTAPILLLAFTSHRRKVTMETAGLSLMLTANMIDLIPNATITPLSFLIAGALAGRLEREADDPLAEGAEVELYTPAPGGGVSYRRATLAVVASKGRTPSVKAPPAEGAQPRYSRFAKSVPRGGSKHSVQSKLRYRKPRDKADE